MASGTVTGEGAERIAGSAGSVRHDTAGVGNPRRVLMAAGGTGGHIFPALAVAEELRARSERLLAAISSGSLGGVRNLPDGRRRPSQVEFLGTDRGLEARVIPPRGFVLRTVRGAGLKGIGGWRKLANLAVLPVSAWEAARVLREFQPDVVVGMGAYLAGPVMLEAAMHDIPTVLIEPNAVPGLTNRWLAPVVRAAAVGFEETAQIYGTKAVVTGHPVRRAFFSVPAKEHTPPFTVLVVGGSQGARAINECLPETASLLAAEIPGCRVVHQTGQREFEAVREAYRSSAADAEVVPFIDDVPQAFARADVVVSRAGASSIAELAAAGKASVLVPFPGAADQHQLANARALERAGGARVIEQRELTPQRLAGELLHLLADPRRLEFMERAARGLARPDAVDRVADLIEELAR